MSLESCVTPEYLTCVVSALSAICTCVWLVEGVRALLIVCCCSCVRLQWPVIAQVSDAPPGLRDKGHSVTAGTKSRPQIWLDTTDSVSIVVATVTTRLPYSLSQDMLWLHLFIFEDTNKYMW